MGCSSRLLRPWARRWINHLSPWRMTSATPGLRLPSHSQDVAAQRLVTEAHVCKQLAQGRYLTAARPGVELATSRVARQRLNHYTARPNSYWWLNSLSVLQLQRRRPVVRRDCLTNFSPITARKFDRAATRNKALSSPSSWFSTTSSSW